jgi:hypothetical protein
VFAASTDALPGEQGAWAAGDQELSGQGGGEGGGDGGTGEWSGATPGACAAAAVGAAWAERARGGRALVLLDARAAAGDGLVAAAADLAEALGLDNLAIAGIGGAQPSFWRAGQADARWFSADDVAPAPPTLSLPPAGARREWPAVQVAGLGAGGIPAWPVDAAHDGRAAAAAALAWVAERTPALLRPHADAPWSAVAADAALMPAVLHGCAQLAAEGRRVAWVLPPGTPLRRWAGWLAAIGRRGLGLKLLVDAGDLPDVAACAALTTWWTMLPQDAHETASALAHALDHEDPVLIGLPGRPVTLPATLAGEPWTPGAGRWLASGAAGTVVAAQAAPVAWALRQELAKGGPGGARTLGLLRCASLMPLPLADLAEAPRPLVVVEDAASRGLATTIAQALPAAAMIRLEAADHVKIPGELDRLLAAARTAIVGV